jgi:hypothetical protein
MFMAESCPKEIAFSRGDAETGRNFRHENTRHTKKEKRAKRFEPLVIFAPSWRTYPPSRPGASARHVAAH